MQHAMIVLDANILIRAVLGITVRELILSYHEQVTFLTPDVCIADVKKHLPLLMDKRSLPIEPALVVLDKLTALVQVIENTIYQEYGIEAKKRIASRDVMDWPIVATALAFYCPVWTEDRDFFGSGLSVWTTDRIPLFFESLLN